MIRIGRPIVLKSDACGRYGDPGDDSNYEIDHESGGGNRTDGREEKRGIKVDGHQDNREKNAGPIIQASIWQPSGFLVVRTIETISDEKATDGIAHFPSKVILFTSLNGYQVRTHSVTHSSRSPVIIMLIPLEVSDDGCVFLKGRFRGRGMLGGF